MKTLQTMIACPAMALFLSLLLLLSGCASVAPNDSLRVAGMPLAACPDSPNCVNSEAERGDSHFVEPIALGKQIEADWKALKAFAADIKRSKVLHESEDYLHVQVSSFSRLFRDDLELRLLNEQGLVHIRSASRLGYSDFGVNRKRVEALRQAFLEHESSN